MAMGPEKWKEIMEEPDNKRYFLENEFIEEEEDHEDGDDKEGSEDEEWEKLEIETGKEKGQENQEIFAKEE